jgi:preprotein translocase subunit SecF
LQLEKSSSKVQLDSPNNLEIPQTDFEDFAAWWVVLLLARTVVFVLFLLRVGFLRFEDWEGTAWEVEDIGEGGVGEVEVDVSGVEVVEEVVVEVEVVEEVEVEEVEVVGEVEVEVEVEEEEEEEEEAPKFILWLYS